MNKEVVRIWRHKEDKTCICSGNKTNCPAYKNEVCLEYAAVLTPAIPPLEYTVEDFIEVFENIQPEHLITIVPQKMWNAFDAMKAALKREKK